MDGVLIEHGAALVGAASFLQRLEERARSLLVVTNNSLYTPLEAAERLGVAGLPVAADQIFTSALASAAYVARVSPGARVLAIGREAVTGALRDVGCTLVDRDAEVVLVGETWDYSFEEFARAIQSIERGALFVATNPEPTGPSREGSLPGVGAMCALIERATGVAPYVVGKPNPLMVREALSRLDASPGSAVFVGDRVETDIGAAKAAGLATVLVQARPTERDEAPSSEGIADLVVSSLEELLGVL